MEPKTSLIILLSTYQLSCCHVEYLIGNRGEFGLSFSSRLLSKTKGYITGIFQLSLYQDFTVVFELNGNTGRFEKW